MNTFFLSPEGNNRWSGGLSAPTRSRRNGPWASLAGARDNLRTLRTAGKVSGPVTLLVQDGCYELRETVEFTQEDVNPTEVGHEPEQRQDHDLGRHHEGDQNEEEDQPLAAEVEIDERQTGQQ